MAQTQFPFRKVQLIPCRSAFALIYRIVSIPQGTINTDMLDDTAVAIIRFPFRKVQLIHDRISFVVLIEKFPFRKVQLIRVPPLLAMPLMLFPFRKVQLILPSLRHIAVL